MALSIEYFDAAGSATNAGVFIPVADMPGVDAAELAAGESTASKEGKTLLSLVNATLAAVNAVSPLGLTMVQSNNSNSGPNLIGLNFTMTWSKLIDVGADTVSAVPLPATGANTGLGGLAILDVFPNAAKVAAAGAVSGAGVVISDAGLAVYGADAPTVQAGDDDRKWMSALFDHMADADVRETGVTESAVTSAALGLIAATTIPESYYAAIDPTSGISAADLPKLGLVDRSTTLQIQVQLNQSTQSFDVVVA